MNILISETNSNTQGISFKQIIKDKLPSAVTRIALLVTTEYEGIFRNGGIGTYYRNLSERLAAQDYYVVLLLCQSQEKFGGESTIPALKHIFSTSGCQDVIELQPTHLEVLSQLKDWEWIDHDNYCALFFAQAIATTFPNAYIYIEFPEMLGLGYRTVQAKRTGILGENCVVAVTLHSGQEWLQEAHARYTQPYLDWFWQASHYEQYSFEQADLAFFLSHFLKDKVAKYGWKTSHAKHLPYCFSVIEQPLKKVTPRNDWQGLVDDDKIPLVFFGRLEERKGLFTFIKAIELLDIKLLKKVHVIFLGKNVELQADSLQGLDSQQYIQQKLGSKCCYSVVTDLFSQEAIQLVSCLRNAIVCLTSSQENFPNTALEMGQLKVSLIVSDTGGFRETLSLIERTSGVRWFIPQDVRSLQQAMIQVISAYPEPVDIPTKDFLYSVNQRLLHQRLEYMK